MCSAAHKIIANPIERAAAGLSFWRCNLYRDYRFQESEILSNEGELIGIQIGCGLNHCRLDRRVLNGKADDFRCFHEILTVINNQLDIDDDVLDWRWNSFKSGRILNRSIHGNAIEHHFEGAFRASNEIIWYMNEHQISALQSDRLSFQIANIRFMITENSCRRHDCFLSSDPYLPSQILTYSSSSHTFNHCIRNHLTLLSNELRSSESVRCFDRCICKICATKNHRFISRNSSTPCSFALHTRNGGSHIGHGESIFWEQSVHFNIPPNVLSDACCCETFQLCVILMDPAFRKIALAELIHIPNMKQRIIRTKVGTSNEDL